MSAMQSIYATLDIKFTQENFRRILQKGSNVGLIYFASEEDGTNYFCVNADQAAVTLLTITEEIKNNGGPFLSVNYQDTAFNFHLFVTEENKIKLSFSGFCPRWNKDFEHGGHDYLIDFARYIKLILQVCEEIPLLGLVTFSDDTEVIIFVGGNCIVAGIDLGSFERLSCDRGNARKNLEGILGNGMRNGFIFFDEETETEIEPSLERICDVLKADFYACLYAKVDGIPFKIEIKRNVGDLDFVFIHPIEPHKIKMDCGNEKEVIDLAFYIQRTLELCEDFAIFALKASL